MSTAHGDLRIANEQLIKRTISQDCGPVSYTHLDVYKRQGFGGNRYQTTVIGERAYRDYFDNYLEFLEPRLQAAYRLLKPDGSFYFHIDYREVHYCKVLLDEIFGRDCFLNEIIWAYDFGGRSKNRWPAKHDNILYYVKDPAQYTFNRDEVDRIPYMAVSYTHLDVYKRQVLS